VEAVSFIYNLKLYNVYIWSGKHRLFLDSLLNLVVYVCRYLGDAEMHGLCIMKLFLCSCGIIYRGAVLLQVRLQNVAVRTGHILLTD
jgi:hypothetical protein